MVIGVSQRVDVCENRGEIRDALDQRLVCFLTTVGLSPIPIPNTLNCQAHHHGANQLKSWLSEISPRGFVLSGGNNIGEHLGRDTTERYLLGYAKENRLPTLGICRGMQMMATYDGTSLRKVDGHIRTRHKLTGLIDGEVNSYHGYSLYDCPPGFTVLARSEDANIEAIRHEQLPWEGWMWHPERENVFCKTDVDRCYQLFLGS